MQMMSWSWGWRPDRDHRIQPGYPQWCSVKVKSPYLSSCSSVFVAAREKKIIELISILILPEVALYRSLDSQDQIRFCFPVYLKPSQKVSVISLAQDWIVLWRRSLLIEQHEWQFCRPESNCCSSSAFCWQTFAFWLLPMVINQEYWGLLTLIKQVLVKQILFNKCRVSRCIRGRWSKQKECSIFLLFRIV